VGIILLVFLMNQTAVFMLSEVYRLTKLGSYQEIGYKVSKSNPGYIYMISAIKAIYLVVTCGYCLQFVTSYPLSVIMVLTHGLNDKDAGAGRWLIIALIYLVLLSLTSSLMLYLYKRQLNMSQLLFQAKLLFYFVVANVVSLMILLTVFGNDDYKNFIFEEVCENGGIPSNSNEGLNNNNYTWTNNQLC
jgi:hypothetical protein